MRYFYLNETREKIGPYSLEELRQLHLSAVVKPETQVIAEGETAAIPFQQLWQRASAKSSGGTASAAAAAVESFTQKATEDIRALVPQLMVPVDELKSFRWVENRKLLFIAAVGLFPLVVITAFADYSEIKTAYWAMAFYFSALWALFFYYVFPTPEIKVADCFLCFFGTGVISIAVLLLAYKVPPLTWLSEMTGSRSVVTRLGGYIFGVGVPEEACKALVLFFIARRAAGLPPQAVLFYGLMAGLGFGIYEGVDYQMGRNLKFARGVGEYYLLNLIRLTTLPFLHAVWTGIAGYFIGFAFRFPERKRGLLLVAIGLPALMHGLYDTATSPLIQLLLALISVFALVLYLARSRDFENVLTGTKAG